MRLILEVVDQTRKDPFLQVLCESEEKQNGELEKWPYLSDVCKQRAHT